MKSVLISIRPKWCELIASGKKTVEVRRTRPNIEVPFKCYIYETKAQSDMPTFVDEDGHVLYTGRGQVIGEFVCNCVKTYPADDFVGAEDFDGSIITKPKDGVFAYWIPEENETCLSYDEIRAYGNGKTLYGWHIFDLKIYDKPKELGEFKKAGFLTEEQWLFALYPNTHCHYEAWAKKFEITKPFQSWGYVEEVKK